MKGLCDTIEPETIDVSSSDLIVIGTPVWAGRATPAINAAVAALKGCDGKKAVIYATCGGKERETIPILKKALEAKGVTVAGEFVFDKTGVKDPNRINGMVTLVKSMGSTS
jgi:flavorubredoxin